MTDPMTDSITGPLPCRPSRRRFYTCRLGLPRFSMWVALGVGILGLGLGCSTRPPERQSSSSERNLEDPWPGFASELRRGSDLAAIRQALEQLRNSLGRDVTKKYQPESLSAEQERSLKELLTLNDVELREVREGQYSALDAHYLAECLYLRDTVRSLDVQNRPAEVQAQAAWDWVCRQLVLNPWLLNRANSSQWMPPLDVLSILQRGYGSGLERAMVFLALGQQLGLDLVLVGSPRSGGQPWSYRIDPTQSESSPSGPFWAVALRVDGDLILWCPWRGERFPGTWQALKQNPALLGRWNEDSSRPYRVVPVDLQEATIYLAPALSSLAPRFRRMETQLENEIPKPQFFVDVIGTRARFEAAKLPVPSLWQAAGDPFTSTRALMYTTSQADGGQAPNSELRDLYRLSLIPQTTFTIPEVIRPRLSSGGNDPGDAGIPELYELIRNRCFLAYEQSFLLPPTPRERLQRGQFSETIPQLIEKRKTFLAAQERLRTDRNRNDDAQTWAKPIREAYTKLLRARDKADTNTAAAIEAQQLVEKVLMENKSQLEALFDVAFTEAGLAESTFLVAMAMHERAEQAYRRYERLASDPRYASGVADAKDKAYQEWNEARGWWSRYRPLAEGQSRYFQGRQKLAERLSERAERLASELKN